MSLITSHLLDDVRLYASCNAPIREETAEVHLNGDNSIKNFNFGGGGYILGYTFGKVPFTALLVRHRKTKFLTVYLMIYLPKLKI